MACRSVKPNALFLWACHCAILWKSSLWNVNLFSLPWKPGKINLVGVHYLLFFIALSIILQVLQARFHPDSPARLQHDPRGRFQEPCDWPAVRGCPQHKLSTLHLQLLQQTMGGKWSITWLSPPPYPTQSSAVLGPLAAASDWFIWAINRSRNTCLWSRQRGRPPAGDVIIHSGFNSAKVCWIQATFQYLLRSQTKHVRLDKTSQTSHELWHLQGCCCRGQFLLNNIHCSVM